MRTYSASALSLLPHYNSKTILQKHALYTITKDGSVTVSYTRRVCLLASRPTARDFTTILGHAPIDVPCIVADKANIESLAQTQLNEPQLGIYAGVAHALYPFPVGSAEDHDFLSNHKSMYQNPGIHTQFWPILIHKLATHQHVNNLSRQQIWLEDERGLLRCGTDRPWLPIAIDMSQSKHGGGHAILLLVNLALGRAYLFEPNGAGLTDDELGGVVLPPIYRMLWVTTQFIANADNHVLSQGPQNL
ncbi:uncharacterized protein ACA1_304290 [Acanthamoeba castellanii str. Neff]|uniref:Uncharacterized protein n=1 Tax=Acanthamoeba castellanii (strain ATCC 30010 / Neff) TaxID=1257118 RepID=L8GVK9_ACACF|nr:uncharacterized protein ACA1_304290 [Acanthamoeba castellanii str. Neff]ELR16987.1 hypothetical protein ACA1_304290 [Acanthamoeba castellanii str. Neff]